MKNQFHKSFLIALISISLFTVDNTKAGNSYQDDIPVLSEGYYLVAGAFNIRSNAIRYSQSINAGGENSKIGINPSKNIYYVYVDSSGDLEFIKTKWREYRGKPAFSDAWVFKNVPPTDDDIIDIEPDSQPSATIALQEEQEIFEDPSEKPENQAPQIEIPEEVEEPLEGEGFAYVFNVVNATTLKEVPGFITVVDAARDKVMTSVETNKPVLVPDPGTAEKKVLFIADIFGFVKQQVALDLEDPLASVDPNLTQTEDGTVVVNFELIRHKAGDIITMYHVYFYNDAAIMKPESQFELNSLLDMLQENEALRIKIHGHTNGNAPGPIIRLRDDDDNFFAMTDNNIEGTGSAKKLSAERSKTIKKWLMTKGIDEKRMDLKGWGGKKMLYDKKSEQAKRNVRVEIEIVKD